MNLFRFSVWAAVRAVLVLAAAVAVLVVALPVLAQESPQDLDGVREGAVSLGDQSPDRGRQFFRGLSLDRSGGDGVDYFTFTTDGRYVLGLGARDQSVELGVTLEDSTGAVVDTAGPPLDPAKDQVHIEWLKVTIDAGTYYIRVEALQDGATGYYLRFGLTQAPNSAPVFGSESYSFSMPEDAAAGAAVGSVSASDADGDTVAYTIAAGDADARFAIDGASGAVTVAGALDYETGPTYGLTVQADDGNGATAQTQVDVTVTDVAEHEPPVDAPPGVAVPVDLVGVATHRSVVLSWTVPAQPVGVYVGDMYLERLDERGEVEWSGWVAEDLEVEEASRWSKSDLGLAAGTVLRYRVRLVAQHNGGGWFDVYSPPVSVTTQTEPPQPPTGLSAVVEGSEVSLSWTVPQQPSWVAGVRKLQVQRSTGRYFRPEVSAWLAWERGVTAYEHTDTAPWAGRVYEYRIAMHLGSGAGVHLSDIVEVPVPAAAATLTATAGHDQVELSWTVPEPRQWGPVDTVELLRDGTVVAALAWTGETSYSHTDRDVAADTSYQYRLRMVSDNVTANSAAVTATTQAAPEPEPPTLEGSAFDRLTSGENSAVRTATTEDGVRYVQFLKAAPAPAATVGPTLALQPQALPKPRPRWAGAAATGGWTLSSDPVALEFIQPHGLWSDGTTLWVSARESATDPDEKLYAYVLDGGARDADKDIDLAVPDMPEPGRFDLAGNRLSGLWMDDDTVWASASRLDKVLAFHRNDDTADPSQHSAGDRKPGEDFTLASGNGTPMGLWSDGTNMYVADYGEGSPGFIVENGVYVSGSIFVYDLATKALATESCGFSSHSQPQPVGVWSDGTSTLWVSDDHLDMIAAYRLEDCARYDPRLDVYDLAAENVKQMGMWSDGSHLWVADRDSNKVFIYDLPGGDARLESLTATSISLTGFTPEVTDYTRNLAGTITKVTVAAETMQPDARFSIAPADADTVTDGHQVSLTTGTTTTVTVTVTHRGDSRTYTLKLTPKSEITGTPSDDATLSDLSLSGVTLDPAFDPDVTEYRFGLTQAQLTNGLTTTVTATANHTAAEVSIKPDDADAADGHQVEINDLGTIVEVTVTAQDGSTRTYTMQAGTVSRDESEDISIPESTGIPFDIWSDGETMWLVHPDRMRAHDMETGERAPSKDHNTLNLPNRYGELGMWSDGDTKWISMIGDDVGENIVHGIDADTYGTSKLVSGESFYPKERGARFVRDLWSDGETVWLAPVRAWDWHYTELGLDGGKLLAYDLETKARQSGKDIAIGTTGHFVRWGSSNMSFAIWSDGTILWVVSNWGDDRSKLEAHKLSDGSRVPSLDIPTGAHGITDPRGIWSDGRTMWVLDAGFQTEPELRRDIAVYAYTLAPNAKLYSLEMSGVDFGHFIHGRPKYTASVANSVNETTVAWEQAFTGGSAAVAVKAVNDDGTSTTDADAKDGYQVDLAEGDNTITVTVTAPNGTDTYTYTVTITREPS